MLTIFLNRRGIMMMMMMMEDEKIMLKEVCCWIKKKPKGWMTWFKNRKDFQKMKTTVEIMMRVNEKEGGGR